MGALRPSAKNPQRSAPRLSHPLCGAPPGIVASLFRHARHLTPGGWARLLIALGASIGRAPFTVAERLGAGRAAAETPLRAPPIFIVGHWRSGTTHLYNVLSRDPRFGYVSPIATALPSDFIVLERLAGGLLRAALPSDRYIDRIPVNPDSPQEDEIALANLQRVSFYFGLYLPHRLGTELDEGVFFEGVDDRSIAAWQRAIRAFYTKLERAQPGKQLLIKNPVYTARVSVLRETFPGCKVIHIHRDPHRVFPSMRNFYRVLLAQFGLTRAPGLDVDEQILRVYPRMMDRLYRDVAGLPEDEFIHVRFEDLDEDPERVVRDIYERLGLGGLAEATPGIHEYLRSVRSYSKNRYTPDPQADRLVDDRWGDWLDRLGYPRATLRDPCRVSETKPASRACASA